MIHTPGYIYLTSTGLSASVVLEDFSALVKEKSYKSVAVVTTATKEKEKGKYSQLAKKQLEELKFERIDFVDLEATPSADFSRYDVVYVCGGNTYKLLHFARSARFDQGARQLLQRGGCYVGVSAGSILLSPSIDMADDPNDIGMTDFVGFHVVDFIVLPHYDKSREARAQLYEERTGLKVERLTNDEALVIHNGNIKRLT